MNNGPGYVESFIHQTDNVCELTPSICDEGNLDLVMISSLQNHLNPDGTVKTMDNGCRSLAHTMRTLVQISLELHS